MTEKNSIVKTEEFSVDLPKVWSKELKLVKEIVAKDCSETEFKLLIYMANQYKLDPLRKQIWAVKYQGRPALIFVSHAGMLEIAHRSEKFGSMSTKIELEPEKAGITSGLRKPHSATTTIYRKDFEKPFESTVYFDEYNRKMALWQSMPKVMLTKCAEVTCLRRAFAQETGSLYTPEEMPPQDNSKTVGGNENDNTNSSKNETREINASEHREPSSN